jgi:hypothetical protein
VPCRQPPAWGPVGCLFPQSPADETPSPMIPGSRRPAYWPHRSGSFSLWLFFLLPTPPASPFPAVRLAGRRSNSPQSQSLRHFALTCLLLPGTCVICRTNPLLVLSSGPTRVLSFASLASHSSPDSLLTCAFPLVSSPPQPRLLRIVRRNDSANLATGRQIPASCRLRQRPQWRDVEEGTLVARAQCQTRWVSAAPPIAHLHGRH